MAGPFPLKPSTVEDHTWSGWPGVYILKNTRDGPPRYVGRSDTDIERRLTTQAYETNYDYFRVEHKETPLEAWVREANLYHHHKAALENEVHPKPPKGRTCPRCSEFD